MKRTASGKEWEDDRMDAFCPTCGALHKHSSKFCSKCGASMDAPGNVTGKLPASSLVHGRYLIINKIGEGGFGAVYQVSDSTSGSVWAMKEMAQSGLATEEDRRQAQAGFKFEAETLERLRHPNLPRVSDYFSEGDKQFLVMEFIDGQTIEELLGRNPKGFPEMLVLGWAGQLCDVLTYLHEQNPPIIFRDLKPGNIMLSKSGELKLIDFGIARLFNVSKKTDTQVLGTPGYAAPEQYGKSQTTTRSDIYSLGVTLYQLLSGYDPSSKPFLLPPLRSLKPETSLHVEAAISKATNLDAAKRFASAVEFRRDLLAPATTAAASTPSQGQAGSGGVQLQVRPGLLDYGTLPAGSTATKILTITMSGSNRGATGNVRALVPWITLSQDTFTGPQAAIQVLVDTSKISGSTLNHTGSIEVLAGPQKHFVAVRVATLGAVPLPAGGRGQASRTPRSSLATPATPGAFADGSVRAGSAPSGGSPGAPAAARSGKTGSVGAVRPTRTARRRGVLGLPEIPTGPQLPAIVVRKERRRSFVAALAGAAAPYAGLHIWGLSTHALPALAFPDPLAAPFWFILSTLIFLVGSVSGAMLARAPRTGWQQARVWTGALATLLALATGSLLWFNVLLRGHPWHTSVPLLGLLLLSALAASFGTNERGSLLLLWAIEVLARSLRPVFRALILALGGLAGWFVAVTAFAFLSPANYCLGVFGLALGTLLGWRVGRETISWLSAHLHPLVP